MEDEDKDELKSVNEIINNINDNEDKPKKRKYTKRKAKDINLVPMEKVAEQVEEISEMALDEEDLKAKLCEDLQVLEYKFGDHIKIKLNYSYPETSIKELRRQKSLFLRLVNESASVSAVFESLVFVVRGGEKITKSLNVIDINGLSEDVNEKREEIITILKELVDCGMLSVAELTPEIKLCMLITNLTINRMEKNKSIKFQKIGVDIVDASEGENVAVQLE